MSALNLASDGHDCEPQTQEPPRGRAGTAAGRAERTPVVRIEGAGPGRSMTVGIEAGRSGRSSVVTVRGGEDPDASLVVEVAAPGTRRPSVVTVRHSGPGQSLVVGFKGTGPGRSVVVRVEDTRAATVVEVDSPSPDTGDDGSENDPADGSDDDPDPDGADPDDPDPDDAPRPDPVPSPAGQTSDEVKAVAERGRLQRDAVGGSLWTSLQTLIVLPLSVIANAVIAHSLGASAYGTLAIYLTVYGVAVSLINAGVSDATVQWLATHNAKGERADLVATVRRCSGFHLYLETPLVCLLAAVMLRDEGLVTILAAVVSVGLTMIIGTGTVVMSGMALNSLAARIGLAATLATQTGLILVARASHLPGDQFAARMALSLLGPLVALFLIPRDLRRAVLTPALPRRWPTGFRGYALRTCGSGVVASLVFGRSELFVFQAYGAKEQAGLFALAAGIAALITAPIDALLGPLLPATAGLLALSPERAGAALLRGLRTSTLLAGLVAAVAVPTLTPLLPVIYGRSFRGALSAFLVLGVVSCFQSLNHPVHAFLLAARRTDWLLRVSVAALVVDLAVAAAAIPLIGITGAVLASTLAQVVVLLGTATKMGSVLGVRLRDQLVAVRYFAVAVAVGAVAYAAQHQVVHASPWARAAVALGTALLGVALTGRIPATGGLTHQDVAAIEAGLPRVLRPSLRMSVRVFALTGRERPAYAA